MEEVRGGAAGEEHAPPGSPDSVLDRQLLTASEDDNEGPSARNDSEDVMLIDARELSSHKSRDDAWIVVDGEVYDVTHFLDNHPGGSEILMEHISDEDVYPLMRGLDKDSEGHSHSDAAFNMLKQFHVGRLSSKASTPVSAARLPENGSKAFTVDLSKPLVFQVGHLREEYHTWVHQAIITKDTPYFFENKFLEFNTRTVWWVVPLIWVPVVCWTQWLAFQRGLPLSALPTSLLAGVFLWSFIEYTLHRFLFHIKTTGYWSNTGHYLLHGCHHKFPLDGYRLVFPPAATSIFGVLFWNVLKFALPAALAPSIFGGGLLGYVMYDLIHYFLHHGAPFNGVSQKLKRYHLNHHFKEQTNSFGITSSLWDWVLDTLPPVKVA
ncbi:unnamed protein product [Calypogeia fissa]